VPGVKEGATVLPLQQLSAVCWVDGGSQANVINQFWGSEVSTEALCRMHNPLLNCSGRAAGLALANRVCGRLGGSCLAVGLVVV